MRRYLNTLLACFLSALVFLSVAPAAHAASPREAISVTCSCDDPIATKYVEALRRALAASGKFQEVSAERSLEGHALRVNIVSMPLSDAGAGETPRAALSIVVVEDGAIFHQFIETCNKIPLQDCAQRMMDDLWKWHADA